MHNDRVCEIDLWHICSRIIWRKSFLIRSWVHLRYATSTKTCLGRHSISKITKTFSVCHSPCPSFKYWILLYPFRQLYSRVDGHRSPLDLDKRHTSRSTWTADTHRIVYSVLTLYQGSYDEVPRSTLIYSVRMPSFGPGSLHHDSYSATPNHADEPSRIPFLDRSPNTFHFFLFSSSYYHTECSLLLRCKKKPYCDSTSK